MVKVVNNLAERAINSAGSSTLEVPYVFTEVRNLRVSVLKVSDTDDPSVDAQVRNAVVHENGERREDHGEVSEDRGHDSNTAVGIKDVHGLVRLEERSDSLEVVNPVRSFMAGEVDEQVQRPSKGQNEEERS